MCPLGDLLTRAHLDALDTTPTLPEMAERRRVAAPAHAAWQAVLEHRAECAFCRPRARS